MPAPSSSGPTASVPTLFSTPSRPRERFPSMFAPSAPILPLAACLSGCAAALELLTCMSVKICAPSLSPHSRDGSPIAARLPLKPALFACRPGLDILKQIGIAPIREKSVRMTTRLIEGAKSRGWQVNTPENPDERAGTVSVECPHAYAVCRELLAREILVDYRPKAGVRLSPHFYNREDECDFTLAEMEEILKTGAWEKHAAAVTHV